MEVLIVGGGKVGSYLAQILSEEHKVTVIDKGLDKCEYISGIVQDVHTICEDGCEPWVLEMAGVEDCDLVLAVTGDDEDNLVISYLSKYEYDVPKVIARVNNPRNRWLFNKGYGVDVEVSASDVIAKIIEEETTLGEVVTIMKLRSSDIGLVEITIPPDSRAIGKRVSELGLPPETLIVTIARGEAMLIPVAETELLSEDKVLAIANVKNHEALEAVLGSPS